MQSQNAILCIQRALPLTHLAADSSSAPSYRANGSAGTGLGGVKAGAPFSDYFVCLPLSVIVALSSS